MSVADQSQPRLLFTIRPRSGWEMVDIREVWEYRDLLLTIASRDIKVRYKQTALGATWVIVQPLLAGGIFAFVFGQVAHLPAPVGLPYFLFVLAGLLAWNLFSTTLLRASNSLVIHAHLVGKVYFPRVILPMSAVFTALLDFIVVLALLLVVLPIFWHWPPVTILLLPIPLALLVALSLGLGLISAAIAVPFRDIAWVLPTAMQFMLYASPVAYSTSAVPAAFRDLFLLNPLSATLELCRWSIFGVGDVTVPQVLYAAVTSIAVLIIGGFVFGRMERTFADVI